MTGPVCRGQAEGGWAPRTTSGRRPGTLHPVVLAALALVAAGWGQAGAQDLDAATRAALQAQDQALFQSPQVVLETGGHSAPVRQIRFAPSGDLLLSAGFDKTLRTWTLEETPEGPSLRAARVLRPPVWRGYAGFVYALALAPVEIPDEPGQRLLAVAGISPRTPRGAITLYRFPGRIEHPNGDIVAVLPIAEENREAPEGHRDTVMTLAFSPDGRRLASGGLDGRIILWDVATRAIERILTNADPAQPQARPLAVNAVVFAPDGSFLVSGGGAGVLRVWEPGTGRELRAPAIPRAAENGDPRNLPVLGMAIDPIGGRWVVVGREGGDLLRYDTADLTRVERLPKTLERHGPVEALAISPDGTKLATSVVAQRLVDPAGRPGLDCDIELRSMPDGRLLRALATTRNLAYALAFSPDGTKLAFSGARPGEPDEAAGDGQTIQVIDLDRADRFAAETGDGRTVWDAGWTDDSLTIAFSRRRVDAPPGPPDTYEAFHLLDRAHRFVPAEGLSRAVESWNGWRVRYVDFLNLDLVSPEGAATRIALDPEGDRRWWAHSFLPPREAAGHASPVLAVACDGGVILFDLQGKRLRYLDGHEGPVYTLAPSPDGRWLATGSADQTVRLWTLSGCDQPATLGLTLRHDPDGAWRVETVDRLGFADRDRMRLKPGDQVIYASIGPNPWRGPYDAWKAAADAAPPKTIIQAIIRRGGEVLGVNTSKRDKPVLSLFVGVDREWVVWMPEGYYETSPIGDMRYLKWQRNGPNVDRPADVFPADRFEAELRRPDVLAILVQTASLDQALAAVPPAARDPETLVAQGAPPVVAVSGPVDLLPDQPFVAAAPVIQVTPDVTADDGRSLIREVRVQVDGRTIGAPRILDPPQPRFNEAIDVPLASGTQRVSVVAVNEQGRRRVSGFDVTSPEAPKTAPRFAILAVGVAGPFQSAEIPRIPFADGDARDVADGYAELAAKLYPEDRRIVLPPVADTDATAASIQAAFDAITEHQLGPGDTLLVMLETHYVHEGDQGYFVGTDAGRGTSPIRGIPAVLLGDQLASVAATQCRVIVLLDAVHPGAPREWSRGLEDWIRDLTRRDVIPFVASNSGPSERYLSGGHGAFAQGLLTAPTPRGQSRLWNDPARGFTLADFRTAVIRQVKELTSLRQQAACYFPETISPRGRLFPAADSPVP